MARLRLAAAVIKQLNDGVSVSESTRLRVFTFSVTRAALHR